MGFHREGTKIGEKEYLLVKIRSVVESPKPSAEFGDDKNGKEEAYEAKKCAEVAEKQAEEAARRADRAEKRANEMASEVIHLRGQVSETNSEIQEAKRSEKVAKQQTAEAEKRAYIAVQGANEMASLIGSVFKELRQLRVQMTEINTGLEETKLHMRGEFFWIKYVPLYTTLLVALLILVSFISSKLFVRRPF